MSTIQSLGIGSGLNIDEIVTAIVDAERVPKEESLTTKVETAEAKISAYGEIKSRLSTLQSSISSLKQVGNFNKKDVSTDGSAFTATATSLAETTSYSVEVNSLAQSQSLASGSFASVEEVIGTGTLTIKYGTTSYSDDEPPVYSFEQDTSESEVNITIDSNNNSVSKLKDYINSQDYGFSASIINDGSGYRLVLSADSGASNSLQISVADDTDYLHTLTFEKNEMPLNLTLVDVISDMSDRRSIWRHHTSFVDSNITETIFTKSDLRYAEFHQLDINNVDFTDANLSNAVFRYVNFNDVKIIDDLLSDTIDSEGFIHPPNTELNRQDISNKKFITLDDLDGDNFNVVFDHALDYPPINWSMGMTIYDEKLYVVDTDNHRIIVYDLGNNEKLSTFTSPIQEHCVRSEECALENRNLPTSIEIIDEKIFVAYGFQDEIQVFDLNGVYLWKFGSSGTQAGHFNTPHRLAALNNELFVADSENHRIQVFDIDGNFLRQFGTYGDSIGQLSSPIDVHAYDSQIFVADSARASILVFDLNGEFAREFEVGQNTSDISQPFGVFVYDDLIFVSDVGDSTVKIFDLDGNFVKQFGQYGDRYGEFNSPNLAITDGNRIFVSDAYNYRIQIFNIVP